MKFHYFSGIGSVIAITTGLLQAQEAPVNLRSAAPFAVLAGATVTSSGKTVVTGDLGAGPGTAVEGFPPGTVSGTIHAGDNTAILAGADVALAYENAKGRNTAPVTVAGNIGGTTLVPGLYRSTSSLAISSGDLTLDGQGNRHGVFIFQMASTLTTTADRKVILTGGARAENVFWQVGSSATIGARAQFVGTILAQSSITIETEARIEGRALARIGAVSLDSNPIALPLPLAPPMFKSIQRAANADVVLTIFNTPGLALTVQSSGDLKQWNTLGTPILGVTPDTYTDKTAQGEDKRFYRAFYP